MGKKSDSRLAWEAEFIAALARLGMVKRAAQAAGIASGTAYARRKKSKTFAAAWDAALAEAETLKVAQRMRNSEDAPAPVQWQRTFLDTLAETSNVTAAAIILWRLAMRASPMP